MRLSVLLTAGSCGLFLVACSRKPKSPADVALTNDPAPVIVTTRPLVDIPISSTPQNVAVVENAEGSSGAISGLSAGVPGWLSASQPIERSTKADDLVPASAVAGSQIWLSAAAPAGSANGAVFTTIQPIGDVAGAGSSVFTTRTVGIGASVIGLGALLDVGGVWNGNSAGYAGLGQVFAEALGLGFDGQDFSRSGLGSFAQFGPAPWSLLESYLSGASSGGGTWEGGGGPGSGYSGGGNPGYAGGGSDYNNSNKNIDGGGWDVGKGSHETGPVTATPEPGSIVLFATGLLALVPVVRRRRRP